MYGNIYSKHVLEVIKWGICCHNLDFHPLSNSERFLKLELALGNCKGTNLRNNKIAYEMDVAFYANCNWNIKMSQIEDPPTKGRVLHGTPRKGGQQVLAYSQ